MPSAPREAAPPFFNQSAKDHALSSDVGTHWIQQSVLRLFRQEWVEWRFAFDVHCNDFVPLFLLLCARSPQAHTQTSTPPEPQPRISFMTPYFLFAVHALAASQLASARFDCYCHCFEFAGTYCNTCCCRCCFPKVSSCRSSAMCSMRSPSVANTTSHSSATASFHTSCEYFAYPVGQVLAAFVCSLPATLRSGFSSTWFVAGTGSMYFGVD